MSNILITGANGYIGKHVVKEVLNRGHKVIAVDVINSGIDERAEFIQCSIFDNKEKVEELADKADVCIHMAWRNGFVHNADSHIEELWGHYSFLNTLVERGIKQLVVMGTMHEIGYWEGAINEFTPANPTSKYGIAKNALRQLIFERVKGTETVLQWLRCYYITGDDLRNNSIFAKILQASNEGKTTFPFTSGKNMYDFIDVDELAVQIACVASQTDSVGIINCCTGKPMTLADKVEGFIKENNLQIKLEYGKFPDRPYDSPGVWGDNAKIQDIMKQFY
ncbi:MAG: NAD-dependent epimerase/dehydratase family protein [Lachnospiraceae bacterium]